MKKTLFPLLVAMTVLLSATQAIGALGGKNFTSFGGPTTLSAGDMAFTDFMMSDTKIDSNIIRLIVFKDLAPGTVIKFTDYCWRSDKTPGDFSGTSANEGIMTWTVVKPVAAGSVIRIWLGSGRLFGLYNDAAGTDISNEMVTTDWTAVADPMSSIGDQLYVYQQSGTTYTHITAFDNTKSTNSTGWTSPGGQAYAGALPAALTNGVNALGMVNTSGSNPPPNWHYVGPVSKTDATTWRSRLFNANNWSASGSSSVGNTIALDGAATGTPPTLSTISDTHICKDSDSGILSFTITDQSAGTVKMTATSSNTTLVPNGAITFDGSGANRTVQVFAASGQTGTADITLTATNETRQSGTTKFTLTVTDFSVNVAQTNVSCYGSSNGSATLIVSGNTAPFTYAWSPTGGSAATASGLSAGTYVCVVSDANNCTKQQIIKITQPEPLGASVSFTNLSCNGAANGSASVAVNGGTAPYSYSWSPTGGSTATATGLSAGNYTCTITDANGCQSIKTAALTQPSALSATAASFTNPACAGQSNGSASATISGGTAPYTYSWTGSTATTATASGLAAGKYSLSTTDDNGCVLKTDFTLVDPAGMVVTNTQVNVGCYGESTGSATANVSGGTTPYTYAWTGVNASQASAATVSGLAMGSYKVNVTDANGCTGSANVSITQPNPLNVSATSTQVSCYDGSNGAISLSTSGGTAPYTYSWSNGPTTSQISGLRSAPYIYTVKDANGCSLTRQVMIYQPMGMFLSIAGQTNESCNGSANGAAKITAANGAAPYTYSWTGSSSTSNSISAVKAGTYIATVTDANGCSKNIGVTISEPAALTTSVSSQTNLSCKGNNSGAATVSVAGGTAPYTYAWTNNGGTAASASGLPAGPSACTVTDANGCTTVQTVTLTEPAAVSASLSSHSDETCPGTKDGSAAVSAQGGTGAYSYAWSPSGGSAATAGNLAVGKYTCYITDANGCKGSADVTIATKSGMTTSVAAQSDILCQGSANGTATVSVSGGTPITTVSFTHNGNEAIPANNYIDIPITVSGATGSLPTAFKSLKINTTISDVKGLDFHLFDKALGNLVTLIDHGTVTGANYTNTAISSSGTASLSSATAPFTGTFASSNSIDYPSSDPVNADWVLRVYNNDTISTGVLNNFTLTFSGSGAGTYNYSWSPSGATTATATGLSAGVNTCTITDASGCTAKQSVTINQPGTLVASVAGQTSPSCFGGSDGTATIKASGGSGTLTYTWNTGATVATLTGLKAGTYVCTVTDANNCSTTKSVTITDATQLTAGITKTHDINCNNGADGVATVVAAGGKAPYTYNWTGVSAQTVSVSALAAGSYGCTITDANSCTTTASITFTNPSGLAIALNSTTLAQCNGVATGSASISVTGGTMPYTYLWSNGSTAQNPTNLPGGKDTVFVTDHNGCSVFKEVVIDENAALVITINSETNPGCYGKKDGTINVTAAGGTTPYAYTWSNGTTGNVLSAVGAGNYTLTLTDGLGCKKTKDFTLTQPEPLAGRVSSQTNESCFSDALGSITVHTSGGTGTYTYAWTAQSGNNPTAKTATLTGLTVGTYTATITDNNGCIAQVPATLTQPADLVPTVSAQTNVLCYGQSNGAATLAPTGGTAPYSYNWTSLGGTSTASVSNLAKGTFACIVTDANGCQKSQNVMISQPDSLVATILTSTNVSCNGAADGKTGVTVSGGTASFMYNWTNGANTANVTGLAAGNQTVKITDDNGCQAAASVRITEPDVLTTYLAYQVNVSCNGLQNGKAMAGVKGGTANYTYKWTAKGNIFVLATTALLSNVAAGDYICTVTDTNNCQSVLNVTITEPKVVSLLASAQTNVSCYGLSNGAASVAAATGGTSPYTYDWTGDYTGDKTTSISGIPQGTYTCTAYDANGCTNAKTVSFTITQPDSLAVSGTSVDASCYGTNDGSVKAAAVGGTKPYAYSWTNINSTASQLTSLAANVYTLTVTDANQCTGVKSFSIEQPKEIKITGQPAAASICSGFDTYFNVTGTNNTTFQWQSYDGTNYTDIAAGDAKYAGATTPTLTVHATTALNNMQYRCVLGQSASCYVTSALAALTVNSSPPVSVSMTYISPVCNNDAVFTLTQGSPAGGSYTVNNQPSTQFNPAAFVPGTFPVTYTIQSPQGCKSSYTQQVTVKIVTPSTLSKFDPICSNAAPLTLTGGAPLGGTYSGTGVKNGVFDPKGLSGLQDITYTNINQYHCNAPATVKINVSDAPVPQQLKLEDICSTYPAFALSVNPVAGEKASFSGDGVDLNNNFNPAQAGVGKHKLVLTVTNAGNCVATDTTVITVKQGTRASIAPIVDLCNNEDKQTLEGLPSGGTYIGQGVHSGSLVPVVLSPGKYQLSYVYVNGEGCADTASTNFNILPVPKSVIIAPVTEFCDGDSAGLQNNNQLNGQWIYEGNTLVGETAVQYYAKQAGNYQLEVSAANGCKGTSDAVAITVNPLPQPVIVYNGTPNFCAQSSIDISTQQFAAYQWYKNGIAINGANSQNLTVTEEGDYTVKVNDGKCDGTSLSVAISTSPPVIVSSNGATTICLGSAVTLISSQANTYQWMKAGTPISGATGQIYAATEEGDYTVFVSDTLGCTATSKSIHVAVKAQPVVTITADALSFCPGKSATLATTETFASYRWKKNGLTVANTNFQNFQAKDSGSYSVVVTNASGCYGSSAAKAITINPAPVVKLSLKGIQSLCDGDILNLSATAGLAGYQWLNSNQPIAGATTDNLNITASGSYRVAVSNSMGCAAVSEALPVTLKTAPQQPIITFNGTVFTSSAAQNYQWYRNGVLITGATAQTYQPASNGAYTVEVHGSNGCSIFANSYNLTNLAVEQLSSVTTAVQVYPNPVGRQFTIATGDAGNYQVFDIAGKKITEGHLEKGQNTISSEEIASGVYQLRVQLNGQPQQVLRILR